MSVPTFFRYRDGGTGWKAERRMQKSRRAHIKEKNQKTNWKEPDKDRTNRKEEEPSRELRRSPDIEHEFHAHAMSVMLCQEKNDCHDRPPTQFLQQPMGSKNPLTRNCLPIAPFQYFFLGNIRERQNRLLASPRGGACGRAAAGLRLEGD